MSPLDRLLLEAIPTRPAPPVHEPWTPEEQQRHLTDLDTELAHHARQTRAHNRRQRPTEAA
ncbi:hypothetical protein ACFWR9_08985 [Streptomyces sp. NPDC058534]|uniref:hypothetical protein n=1 Tax=Streptomyces sp. NPDC058534 TaxID=3346541 RepID=UPI0036691E6C